MFNVNCQYNSTLFSSNWIVTGLAEMGIVSIAPSVTAGPFIPSTSLLGEGAQSTLSVNSQNVENGTCFQCEITTGLGMEQRTFISRRGCVSAVGE